MVTATQFAPLAVAGPASPVSWEEIPCPMCRHDRGSPVIEADDAQAGSSRLCFCVMQCDRCGLQFTNPRPCFESMDRYYPPGYKPHRQAKKTDKSLRPLLPFFRLTGRPCAERRRLPWHGQGRLLDFGCGSGEFLFRMHQQGWKVTGVDTCAKVVREARERLGLNLFTGTLPHPRLPPCSFDVVTMWSSLENAHQPLETLKAAYRLLVPGGRLYVAVPNIDSWGYRWFKQYWHGLDLPRHLTHFDRHTLRTMLEITGFRVDPVRQLAHPGWLRQSARNAVRGGQSSVLQKLLSFKPVRKGLAWLCYLTGQADSLMASAERPAA